MKFPYLDNIPEAQSILTTFGGYNHNLRCQEGEFYDMKNMTTEYYPFLSPRTRRGIVKNVPGLQGFFELDGLVYVADNRLFLHDHYIERLVDEDGNVIEISDGDKTITKMGAYLVIFPDGIWYNLAEAKCGKIEAKKEIEKSTVKFSLVDADGDSITLWTGSGTPDDGAYKITTKGGKKVLQTYSKTTSMWMNVASTFFKIEKTGIGTPFKKGDGIKITLDATGLDKTAKKNLNLSNVFVNDEGDNKYSNNFVIKNRDENYVIVTGIIGSASVSPSVALTLERKCPDVAFVCECQNRLWVCNKTGTEISCCKQGDVTNWNSFAGVSLDSWTATVGSEGEFTGAFAYMGNPIFFKERSLLKVTISSAGAHSYKEIECRGVQKGSDKSLVMLNELLFYKSATNVCYYDGNFPQEIGDSLGNVRYKKAVGGSINNRYYMSCMDEEDNSHMFVFDIKTNCWAREDATAAKYFARFENDLYFYAGDTIYSVYGTLPLEAEEAKKEEELTWMAESGWIGYETTDKKYLSRMDIRLKMNVGAHVSLFMEYDSSGIWEYVWNVAGKGTKTFAIPVRPKRCDHYRYRLIGYGDAKVIGIAKAYEEGSDM